MSGSRPFTTVLVANRGEIALRIMRSVHVAGLRSVAVFTDADRDAPHVAFADRAVRIGAGPAGDSYLAIERVIDAARRGGADAIHPGYGFLSESGDFARACADAGLSFIGPPAEAIDAMGNKSAAKRLMQKAEIPCIPGYEGNDQSDETLLREAAALGFPLMIKAAAGGGGRGMRRVENPGDLKAALDLARTEAKSAFGSDQMILEKAITDARHVEIQVLADMHGAVVHLGERDCSVQRRHQKVIEETPSPAVTDDLRIRMGHKAVQAAQAIGYVGAGTVEFLLTDDGQFWFLEMNTRLQVEHPVTEFVTGTDLVALQLDIAQGRRLPFSQDELTFDGHAIEARLYAEDPAQGFQPVAGDIALWQRPSGSGIRVDDGIRTGQTISPFYDPMLGKIIAHGATREEARQKLLAALGDAALFGITTNRDFLIRVLRHDLFSGGQATTDFLDAGAIEELAGALTAGTDLLALAACVLYRHRQAKSVRQAGTMPDELLGWSSSGSLRTVFGFESGSGPTKVQITDTGQGSLIASGDNWTCALDDRDGDWRIDGSRVWLSASLCQSGMVHVATSDRTCSFRLHLPDARSEAGQGEGIVTAPMHGTLLSIDVAENDAVTPGMRIGVLEAMKMQHELAATVAGRVVAVTAVAGAQVKAGDLLVEIEVQPD